MADNKKMLNKEKEQLKNPKTLNSILKLTLQV